MPDEGPEARLMPDEGPEARLMPDDGRDTDVERGAVWVRLPLRRPVRTATTERTDRIVALIRHRRADGVTGWGEYAPWPSPPADAPARVTAACRTGRSDDPVLRTALATAAADADARAVGTRLVDDLAGDTGAPRDRVTVNALVDARAGVDDVRRAADDGFGTVKCKVGARRPDDDVAFVTAVRHAVGDAVRIRLDANGAWDVRTAVDVLQRLVDADVEFVEQPVRGLARLAEVRDRTDVPVAADEDVRDADDLTRCLAVGAADVVVCKPAFLGAPADAVTFARTAARAGVGVVIAGMFDAAVGRAAATAVAAVAPTIGAAGLGTAPMFADDVAAALWPVDGVLVVPDGTGTGCEPDGAALARLRFDPT